RSAVTGDEISLIDVSSQPRDLKKDDLLLLASDGIMTLGEKEIVNILQDMQGASLEDTAVALLTAVEDVALPNQDNATVLLYTPEADYGMEPVVADEQILKSVRVGDDLQKAKIPITKWAAVIIGMLMFGLVAYFLIPILQS
ncbi:MAG: hypothetical protein OXG54_05005, partial [Gammaproteobacteria bacterium]|nr:hypothetical protein [Gammaproteobacteria bacterium]